VTHRGPFQPWPCWDSVWWGKGKWYQGRDARPGQPLPLGWWWGPCASTASAMGGEAAQKLERALGCAMRRGQAGKHKQVSAGTWMGLHEHLLPSCSVTLRPAWWAQLSLARLRGSVTACGAGRQSRCPASSPLLPGAGGPTGAGGCALA